MRTCMHGSLGPLVMPKAPTVPCSAHGRQAKFLCPIASSCERWLAFSWASSAFRALSSGRPSPEGTACALVVCVRVRVRHRCLRPQPKL